MNVPELPEVPNLTVQTNAVSVFYKVSLATMAKAQTKDSVLGLVIQYIHKGDKLKGLAISKFGNEAVQKYFLQFDQLVINRACYITYTSLIM